MRASRQRGFTLIELMIAVVIVSILAAIAVPIYTEYVRRSARSAGQNYLSDLALRQELRFQNTRTYAALLADLYPELIPPAVPTTPPEVATYYDPGTLVIVVQNPVPGTVASFSISINARATGLLAGEGAMAITSAGVRTWVDRHGATKQWSENK